MPGLPDRSATRDRAGKGSHPLVAIRIAELLVLVLLVALAATTSARGQSRVVGGTPEDVQNAPWSAWVQGTFTRHLDICTGVIIDPSHILTAAHCVYDEGILVPAGVLLVRVGVSNAKSPTATDRVQDRAVATIRVHPGYDINSVSPDDIAVLTLVSPLDLSGPTARAIALPAASTPQATDTAVHLSGFGLTVSGGDITEALNSMTGTLLDRATCLPDPLAAANAVLLCAYSPVSSTCDGDSGSALVEDTPTPTVVGIVSRGTCSPNHGSIFTRIDAPEILQFVAGNDSPPLAPRTTDKPAALYYPSSSSTPQVGQTLRCTPGVWTGSPTYTYSFIDPGSQEILQTGPRATYTLGSKAVGRRVVCRVAAANSGGAGIALTGPTRFLVEPAPALSIPPSTAHSGHIATLRIKLVGWVTPVGRLRVCATTALHAGKLCDTYFRFGDTHRRTLVMALPVTSSAHSGRMRVAVTASDKDGRTATAAGTIVVTPGAAR